MKVQTSKGEYNLRWHYITEEKTKKKATHCHIYCDGIMDGSIGITVCSKKDNFCKDTGRKIALTRALSTYPRKFRREVWQAYHNRKKGILDILPTNIIDYSGNVKSFPFHLPKSMR